MAEAAEEVTTAIARGADATTVKLSREFTELELKGIAAARKSFFLERESASIAGKRGHEAAKAAGDGEGIDFVRRGGAFQQDLKFHFNGGWGITQRWLDKAAESTLKYTLQYQAKEGLVPIRSVLHIWVSRTDAVKAVIH